MFKQFFTTSNIINVLIHPFFVPNSVFCESTKRFFLKQEEICVSINNDIFLFIVWAVKNGGQTVFVRIDFNLEILCHVKNKNLAFCKRNFLEQFSLSNLQTELLEWFTTKVYFTISLYVSYILDHNRSLYFSLWSIHFHRKRFLHLNALGIT